MASIASNQCSSVAAQGFTAEALRIVDRIEREVMREENLFGHDRLLHVVSSFGGEAYATHTSYYRRVIRETVWPHGLWVNAAHADFLRGFECSALGYVWTGFEALRFLAGSG